MTRIPPAALLLTIAGLAPFILGALMSANTFEPNSYIQYIGTDGRLIMLRYGVIILCFMSGVLWGFATKAHGTQATACYVLSTLPALWAFLSPGRQADEALINLMIGFIAVLILDSAFSRWRLAPEWWMPLRIPVTIVVLICLALGVWV